MGEEVRAASRNCWRSWAILGTFRFLGKRKNGAPLYRRRMFHPALTTSRMVEGKPVSRSHRLTSGTVLAIRLLRFPL